MAKKKNMANGGPAVMGAPSGSMGPPRATPKLDAMRANMAARKVARPARAAAAGAGYRAATGMPPRPPMAGPRPPAPGRIPPVGNVGGPPPRPNMMSNGGKAKKGKKNAG